MANRDQKAVGPWHKVTEVTVFDAEGRPAVEIDDGRRNGVIAVDPAYAAALVREAAKRVTQ